MKLRDFKHQWTATRTLRVGRSKADITKMRVVEDDVLVVWKADGSIYATAHLAPGHFVRVKKARGL